MHTRRRIPASHGLLERAVAIDREVTVGDVGNALVAHLVQHPGAAAASDHALQRTVRMRVTKDGHEHSIGRYVRGYADARSASPGRAVLIRESRRCAAAHKDSPRSHLRGLEP